MKPKLPTSLSKVALIGLVVIIAISPFLANRTAGQSVDGLTAQRSSDETAPAAPPTETMTISQTLSDEGQQNTIAFDKLAFLTGSLGADSFFPPGKVADFWGLQYLRDNDPSQMGHNPLFLTSAAFNMWNVLTTEQRAQLKTLANAQVNSISDYAYRRFVLMKAFRRLLDGDVPAGSPGLDKSAVMDYSADLYRLDGQMSYDRTQVMGSLLVSLTTTQTTFLNTNMVGKGMLDWPAVSEPADMQGLDRPVKEALMTYSGDLYSWYAGSIAADAYFCPERQGTYFGSFYLKDTPVMSVGGSIDTNLTANAGITFVLTLTPTPERFDMIYCEVQHLQQLVEDLRTLSLADAGELRLNRQPIAPRALLAQVAALFQHRADQQRIALSVDAADTLPDLNIDESRFVQVLGNLVANALRYTSESGHVTLGAVRRLGMVDLLVRDDGAGISSEALPHIFDRFYRADQARQQTTGESGLGLAIARSIVEAHGGMITAESHVGKGTTFTIALKAP